MARCSVARVSSGAGIERCVPVAELGDSGGAPLEYAQQRGVWPMKASLAGQTPRTVRKIEADMLTY